MAGLIGLWKLRNGKLSLQNGDPTANAQMDSLNKQAITSYFNSLKSVLEDNNFQSPCTQGCHTKRPQGPNYRGQVRSPL